MDDYTKSAQVISRLSPEEFQVTQRNGTERPFENAYRDHDGRESMGTSYPASHYRSAIFYTTDDQKRIAEDTITDVNVSGLWPGKVVTELVPVSSFWEAEPEHQDYLERIPNGYKCHFVRPNWILPKRAA